MTKEYGKPGAVVLFGFSFVWPHVKLALLHLFFYLPMTSRGRRNGNYWLAVFGKWSFTDVLVMSALVGVFHLTLDTTASEVWDSAGPDLIETCGGTCGTFMHEKTHPFEGIGQAIEAKLPPLQKFNDWNREQQDKMDAAWDEFVTKQKEKMDSAWDNVFHHGQAPSADFSCSCAWTANFACPDAPMPGNKGYAQKDNSACYAYCCPEDGAASQPSTGLASRIPKVTTAWDNFVDSMKAQPASPAPPQPTQRASIPPLLLPAPSRLRSPLASAPLSPLPPLSPPPSPAPLTRPHRRRWQRTLPTGWGKPRAPAAAPTSAR